MSRRKPKTLLMLWIERDHHGKAIDRLMVEAFQEHGSERRAAQALGITQQSFNHWKFRLGLDREIDRIAERWANESPPEFPERYLD